MAKAYFLLIGLLVVFALAIGGYAFYKSGATIPAVPSYTQMGTTSYPNQPSQATTPTQNNQISLTIVSPKNGTVLSGATVQVTGKTTPGADISINDADLKADAQGNFTTTVNLEEGDNYILVTAVNDSGAVSEQEITVSYTPAE